MLVKVVLCIKKRYKDSLVIEEMLDFGKFCYFGSKIFLILY